MSHVTVPALDEMLDKEIKVLDHGFIRVVDYMGNDDAIVQAARTSYGKGTKKVSEDRGLIRYLMRHQHTTPFEMCEIKFHVKLPIFVARQWVRHRTANINEYSARYSVLEGEFYFPDLANVRYQSNANKQGREEQLDQASARAWVNQSEEDAGTSYEQYQFALENGVAREIARMSLPLNIYTQWYWKIDLHNLFHFLLLRYDPHSQWEIREYAGQMMNLVSLWCPHAYEAFVDYQIEGKKFSRLEMKIIRDIMGDHLKGDTTDYLMKKYDLPKREVVEFLAKMKGPNDGGS